MQYPKFEKLVDEFRKEHTLEELVDDYFRPIINDRIARQEECEYLTADMS
jgi:hypothetical protein